MQTLIQVICEKGKSLREQIIKNRKLKRYNFSVSEYKRQGRANGWSKIHSSAPGRQGALNIEWDSDTCILMCRVVNKQNGTPNLIMGDFIDFLFNHYENRIITINILRR